jgi:hypothetical protein
MIDPAQPLSKLFVTVGLQALLGSYVIYMARKFYADPVGYFRKSAPRMAADPWLGPIVRGLACFCLWGGCFIVATVIAVQILGLHGEALAFALMAFAAIATWFLLPRHLAPGVEDGSKIENIRKSK